LTTVYPPSHDSQLSLVASQVIHLAGFTPNEREAYRQQIWVNVRDGMRACFLLMDDLGMSFTDGALAVRPPLSFFSLSLLTLTRSQGKRPFIDDAPDLHERQPYPIDLHAPIKALWKDTGLQAAILNKSEATVPEKYVLSLLSLR
jgi:guanine nucleotide-binding protein subunit alpha